ncbi:MAG TPA: UvrD-helicase domain-containing protein [Bacteroidota bacterium]|nr:UvrD-helicase domain-containing protein [Bacteroidota bacterium]
MSFLDELNPVQREAASSLNGPCLVLAGAGSGKTRVLTFRVANLIAHDIRPECVLALTFTNKAAEEMKSRIVGLVGEHSRNIWMGTFHSLFARILRVEAERIGYRRNFTIYDTDDSLSQIKAAMGRLSLSPQQYIPQQVRARISHAKSARLGPAEFLASANDPSARAVAAIYEEYELELHRSNAMDFDDLLLKPLDLFLHQPDVLQKYQHRFSHILVDEYQDTNRVQYHLINTLSRQHRNLCVVGDDAQSIYAFRGADIRNILDFQTDYPDAKVFRLEQNYRSTKSILTAASSLIKNNRAQIPKSLWTSNDEGEPTSVERCEDDREEGRRVVSRIEEEISRKKLSLKDVAVLYRTNAQSRAIEDALRRAGIPYGIVGGVAFYRRKEIKDILAYLRLIVNPDDRESILRIINVPARGIGAGTVKKLAAFAEAEGVTLFDALLRKELAGAVSERAARALRDFGTMMRKYQELQRQMSASELARSLVSELRILELLKEEHTSEADSRRQNVEELVSALSEFCESRPDATLGQFLEEAALIADVDTADFDRNAVTLMTLHAAKGLEFPVVFITGLEEGLFPLVSSSDDDEDIEEERRLMYVGITRARRKLYLCHAMSRLRFGEVTMAVRSRFIEEIDRSVLVEQSAGIPRVRSVAGWKSPAPRVKDGPRAPVHKPGERQPDPMPDYENESQEYREPKIGSLVVHAMFGRGRILALEGHGENARAMVDFETVGRKKLLLKFAHLRLQ